MSAPSPAGSSDAVRVEVDVAVEPGTAFDVFTADIGAWWRRGKDLGTGRTPRRGTLHFEGGAGGRLVETYPDADPFTVGEIRVWEPGRRLVFEWRSGNFEPGQSTEVEVSFAPVAAGTRVTLVHRGLDTLPDDHGARHGLGRGPKYQAMMRDWWQQMLGDFGSRAEG